MSRKTHNRQKVSWCAGWNYPTHPTKRHLQSVVAFRGTDDATTLALCPDCLSDFSTSKADRHVSQSKSDTGAD